LRVVAHDMGFCSTDEPGRVEISRARDLAETGLRINENFPPQR
jgi:hypothetical protein